MELGQHRICGLVLMNILVLMELPTQTAIGLKGPLFVRELLDLQEEPKPHYNTLSTIVRSLEEKGYIGYKVYGNTHQYYALVSEDDYRRNFLKQVIGKYYDNSYTRVVSTLIEEEALTIDELQELIRQIKNK